MLIENKKSLTTNKDSQFIKETWELEGWKINNCYFGHDPLCNICCSGGIFLGAFCLDKKEEIKKITLTIV